MDLISWCLIYWEQNIFHSSFQKLIFSIVGWISFVWCFKGEKQLNLKPTPHKPIFLSDSQSMPLLSSKAISAQLVSYAITR